MNILSVINKIIENDYPNINKKITIKTKFKDIELDSLEFIMIIIKLENKLNIKIDDNKLLNLQNKTVKDLINEVQKLIDLKK